MKMRAYKINQYDTRGKLVATHPSLDSAAKAVGCSKVAVSMNITGKTRICQGYVFKKVETEMRMVMHEKTDAIDLYNQMMLYALKLTQNEDEAKDLVQDAYVDYYEKYNPLGGASPRTYILNCIKYAFLNDRRMKPVSLEDLKEDFGYEPRNIEDDATNDRSEKLYSAFELSLNTLFNSIGDEQRRIVTKKIYTMYVNNCSASEIADALGFNTEQAKIRIYRMREFVAKGLGVDIRFFTTYDCNKLRCAQKIT